LKRRASRRRCRYAQWRAAQAAAEKRPKRLRLFIAAEMRQNSRWCEVAATADAANVRAGGIVRGHP